MERKNEDYETSFYWNKTDICLQAYLSYILK